MTVAICPGLTLPISDSLSGTTSLIELRSLRIANAELDELEESVDADVELDAAPAERALAAEPVAPAPDSPELAVLAAFVVPLPETTSPTWPESETIVPLCGA